MRKDGVQDPLTRRVHPALKVLPHALTASRVVLVAFTYFVVAAGDRGLFVVLVLLAVATDMVDGPVARKLGVTSKAGADFDSFADFTFYVSLVAWGYMIQPAVLVPLTPVLVAGTVLYVAVLWLAKSRTGLVGVHNRWSRLSATFGVAFAIYVVVYGWNVILGALLGGAVAADLWLRGRALLGKPPKARPWHA